MTTQQPPRRLIVISDLHIGGSRTPMLGHPDHLIEFLKMVQQLKGRPEVEGEEIELVVNGDFVDFLAEEPHEAWTQTEGEAEEKLKNIVLRCPEIFKAFAECAKVLPRLTVLLGNHDVELAYPRVREAFFRWMGTDHHRCHFIYNNEGYRVGDVLIEHGNRYDTWNAIDHNGLRETVSALSRGEDVQAELKIPPGSRLVHEVMNPLKERYHFVDLLKPEDKLVVLLLSTLEPELREDLHLIFQAASSYLIQVYRKAVWSLAGSAPAPGERKFVSHSGNDGLNTDLRKAFLSELESDTGHQAAGALGNFRKLFLKNEDQSLKRLLEEKKEVDPDRLRRIQMALSAKMKQDRTFDPTNDNDSYAKAAESIVKAGTAQVVVMGHTHLSRDICFKDGGQYLNTGTWADVIRLNSEILEDNDSAREELKKWLRKLVLDQVSDIRVCEPYFADISIVNGKAVRNKLPLLRRFQKGMGTL